MVEAVWTDSGHRWAPLVSSDVGVSSAEEYQLLVSVELVVSSTGGGYRAGPHPRMRGLRDGERELGRTSACPSRKRGALTDVRCFCVSPQTFCRWQDGTDHLHSCFPSTKSVVPPQSCFLDIGQILRSVTLRKLSWRSNVTIRHDRSSSMPYHGC